MGKKKKSTPVNHKSDVMDRLGTVCEKLDKIIELLKHLSSKLYPYVPYVPPPTIPDREPNIVVMYGVRPVGGTGDPYWVSKTTTNTGTDSSTTPGVSGPEDLGKC